MGDQICKWGTSRFLLNKIWKYLPLKFIILYIQSLEKENGTPKNIFLWGSPGSGKTLLLMEVLKIYLAFHNLKKTRPKVLIILYHKAVDQNCELANDMRKKYLKNVFEDADIQILTMEQACKGMKILRQKSNQYSLIHYLSMHRIWYWSFGFKWTLFKTSLP